MPLPPLLFLRHDELKVAYRDSHPEGSALPSMVFIHGWADDSTSFEEQCTHFSTSHRCVLVELRGFGHSEAPPGDREEDFTMAEFAGDVAWLCGELDLSKPVVVGQGMGGQVALELSARFPSVPASVCLISSIVLPPAWVVGSVGWVDLALHSLQSEEECAQVINQALRNLLLPTDRTARMWRNDRPLPFTPRVAEATFRQHVTRRHTTAEAAAACHLPIAYIQAGCSPLSDLTEFKAVTPQLITAKVLGAGHFCHRDVPDQVNAMIEQFIRINAAAAAPSPATSAEK